MAYDFQAVDRVFHPRAVAVIGASNRLDNAGMMYLNAQKELGFPGPIYAINPTSDEKVSNYPTYRRLVDVPGPVDYVVVAVPARFLPEVISHCAEKQVVSVAIFTSGFSETQGETGFELEQKILDIARAGNVRLIGPNCMGLYCPGEGLGFRSDLPLADGESGEVSFISQSGGLAFSGIFLGHRLGLRFQKVVSYGNEIDLSSHELFRYFADDPDTRIIVSYMEGTKDGPELARALRYAGARKPVVVMKGGLSNTGVRAVATHTGSMGGQRQTWESLFRQAGILQVSSLEEMVGTALALKRLPPYTGKRLAIVCMSGGLSVNYTDNAVDSGFEMPRFSEKTQQKIRDIFDQPGTGIQNPIDMAGSFINFFIYEDVFRVLDEDPDIDLIMLVFTMEYYRNAEFYAEGIIEATAGAFIDAIKKVKKPVGVVIPSVVDEMRRLRIEQMFLDAEVPAYPTIERALKVLHHTRDYHERQSQRNP